MAQRSLELATVTSFVTCFLSLLLVAPVATAQPTEKILVPVFSNFPQIGSWRTVVALLNNSTIPISSPGIVFTIRCSGASVMGGCTSNNVPPALVGTLTSPTSAAGLVLEVPASAAQQILFSAHVGTMTRLVPIGGTELPIVRQQEFRRELQIPYVPIRAPSPREIRVHLRIYSLDRGPVDGRILLRSFDGTPFFGPQDVRQFQLGTTAPPAAPMFALYDLQELYPDTPTGGLYRLVVEASPRPDGTVPSIWAFVSAVDLSTQEVVIYRAQ